MSVFLLSLLTSASAADLDCVGLDAEACATANQIAGVLNTHFGGTLIDAGALPTRFDTATVYQNVVRIRSRAANAGCSVDGIMAGAYNADFTFDGHWESPSGAQTAFVSGEYSMGRELASGTYTGDSSGTVGDLFGTPQRNGKVLANKDDAQGFVAGHWARVSGKTGVWYSVTGACGASSAEALSGWFGRDLSLVTFDAVASILRDNCASCHSADLGFGQAPLLAAADVTEAYLATQELCLPGATTCGEEAIVLINVDLKPPAPQDTLTNVEKAKLNQWLAGGMLAP